MEELGFRVTQIYGMTELQGPSTLCEPQDAWAGLPHEDRAVQMARQGVRYPVVDGHIVGHSKTCEPVPKDGKTIGEILIQGNTVMLGYLKDADIEIKDRQKDIIISGGENISSVEVEIALYKHPAVALAAVVARPHEKWGEAPCAFVQLKPGMSADATEIVEFCRANLARYMVPKTIVFGAIPVTATGKIQKFLLRERAKNEKALGAAAD
jgi:fatty-acyl-CoA synthase